MRPLRSVAIYFAFVFLGGSLLAPLIYWLVQTGGSWNPLLHKAGQFSFDRFVTRSCELLAVAGLWPFLKSLNIRGWNEVGLCPPKNEWRKLMRGLGIGFVSLALVAFIAIIAGACLPHTHSTVEVLKSVIKAGLAAIAVAMLEELLFRGVLFGALRKACGWMAALLLSSAFYALVHFLGDAPNPHPLTWLSGFVSFGEMLRGLVGFRQMIPGFLTLFLVGSILALAYQRTGSLYFSVGLHAGWIFWLKSYGFLTRASSSENSWFWGTGKLINGWLAFLILLALLGIFLRWPALFGRKENSA